MARLDIKEATLKKLFALSGNRCAFPGCPQRLVDEHGNLIADVCHIEAAEEDGERYNPKQTDDERRGIANLLVLCPTHHRVTDNVGEYPVARMRKLKADHERRFAAKPFPLDDALAARLAEQLRRRADIAVTKLPKHGAEKLVGREKELADLEKALNDEKIRVVSIVAWGGVGKTALAVDWMAGLAARDWAGVEQYFDWSFYSQGTHEQSAASADVFIAQALTHFGDPDPQAGSPHERGARLAALVAGRPAVLILDGVEPLQHGPGPLAGQLKDPALAALLKGLAQRPLAGLCVVTTREPLTDLKSFHAKTVAEWTLDHLSDPAGAELLHRAGANRAGHAAVAPHDAELRAASHEVGGHALTLQLLGRYLALAHGGDIRRRDRVRFEKADEKVRGGHAFRVIGAYERWLREGGIEQEAAEAAETRRGSVTPSSSAMLAILRLLGLFDRPAEANCLAALRKPPAIAGLTEPLADVEEDDWNIAVTQLAELGLISPPSSFIIHHSSLIIHPSSFPLDAHPLVRDYFARQVQREHPEAWRAAHRRLYEHLTATTEYQPDTLPGLQPLYQAVAHGCQAGLHQKACDDVYHARILRGTGPGGFYSSRKLGAIGADLGAVACFFETPWRRLSPNLASADQAWLLNAAAFRLRALGRLTEAVEPMRVSMDMDIDREEWKGAAISASNLSELELTLGQVSAAVTDGGQSVTFADRSGDAGERMINRTTHADALHQAGRRDDSLRLFREAEAMQAKMQPEYRRLYSVRGFQYCDLLLCDAERAAWRGVLSFDRDRVPACGRGSASPQASIHARSHALPVGSRLNELTAACAAVAERATQTLGWVAGKLGLLTIALDHLTLGRAGLYGAVLHVGESLRDSQLVSQRPDHVEARQHLTAAVDGLRQASTMDHIPRGLFTRAWLRFLEGDEPGCRADLDEAWDLAERGPMPLFQADIHLTRARLFRDPTALAAARDLIQSHGYHRRDEELADAQSALRACESL
jgi:hypothetical protein